MEKNKFKVYQEVLYFDWLQVFMCFGFPYFVSDRSGLDICGVNHAGTQI